MSRRDDRYRLYRNPDRGWLAGVAAGMADYFGADVRLVRLGWVLGLIFFTPPVFIAYIVMILVIPRRPDALFGSEEEMGLRRAVHLGPHAALREAKAKLRDAEDRLNRLEAAVLSEEFQLRRKFRDIG
ncbi:MAG: PspC domain-containing protein [Caenispirillum bisanense]|nr:PspC domain-containing protein [Caenispirillum bisanense]MCA1975291.1 PspC domain-containing protein [Caenispirillum sp.]